MHYSCLGFKMVRNQRKDKESARTLSCFVQCTLNYDQNKKIQNKKILLASHNLTAVVHGYRIVT